MVELCRFIAFTIWNDNLAVSDCNTAPTTISVLPTRVRTIGHASTYPDLFKYANRFLTEEILDTSYFLGPLSSLPPSGAGSRCRHFITVERRAGIPAGLFETRLEH